jgi:Ca2+-binding EF-hand superfamily protein
MPDEHGKITLEEFRRMTGEDPQRPSEDELRSLREELERVEADQIQVPALDEQERLLRERLSRRHEEEADLYRRLT